MKSAAIFILCLSVLLIWGCSKYVDKVGATDPRLSSKYCNDPAAVNYNWNFPGTPDNSVCFYPAPSYQGHYVFMDSILNNNNVLIGQQTKSINFYASSPTNLLMVGFCGGTDTLHLTVDRLLKATVDSVINTGVGFGQLLCRPLDTVSGYMMRPFGDSAIQFYFTVVSDTPGIRHTGTAFKR